MPLQIGSWTMNVGGEVTQLNIIDSTAGGDVGGRIGGRIVIGGWDEDSQTLMLWTNDGQFYVGYLFTDTVNLTGVKGSVVFTLVGSAESFQASTSIGPPPTATRSTFGWYAQIGVD